MKLRCISRYVTNQHTFEPGQVIDLDDADAAFVQRDSPGSFELVAEVAEPEPEPTPAVEVKAPSKPARNKAVESAEVK